MCFKFYLKKPNPAQPWNLATTYLGAVLWSGQLLASLQFFILPELSWELGTLLAETWPVSDCYFVRHWMVILLYTRNWYHFWIPLKNKLCIWIYSLDVSKYLTSKISWRNLNHYIDIIVCETWFISVFSLCLWAKMLQVQSSYFLAVIAEFVLWFILEIKEHLRCVFLFYK